MSDLAVHTHDWQPLAGERGRYACATCPAQGWRAPSGEVRVAREKRQPERPLTAAPSDHAHDGFQFRDHRWRRVNPLPRLDEQEK